MTATKTERNIKIALDKYGLNSVFEKVNKPMTYEELKKREKLSIKRLQDIVDRYKPMIKAATKGEIDA